MIDNTHNKEIGLAVIWMDEMGPQTAYNLSEIDEIASMYLAVKGFTAFMTGFERDDIGPGRIRGILQIPSTELYAVAFDHNMKGLGTEDDPRMKHSRAGIICLIASNEQLNYIRIFYNETEFFLKEKLEEIFSIAVLTEDFLVKLKKDYNDFLNDLINSNQKVQGKTLEPQSVYDVSLLMSLPTEENQTARAMMSLTAENPSGIPLKHICKITKRNKRKELAILENLIRKGLVIVIAEYEEKNGLLYQIK
ncbi:MAG: hypothetical protein ACFFDW_13915 [Candidatus Thorarchaeota archaeon]